MNEPQPPRLSRRAALLRGGAVLLGTAVGTLGTASPAHAGINDAISRSAVIDRAWNWVNRGIQYSQQGTATDAEGNHTYRRDCSGFVSMCWHISPTGLSAPTTWTLPDYANRINKADLRKGDILDWPHNHCVLFQSWANSAQTMFNLFELANPDADMNHRTAYLSSYADYNAYRYRKIVDG
jgi:hypothetical protein